MEEDYIDIVFDAPPGATSGRFVEVENSDGESIKVGEWIKRPDKFWALRILKTEAERALTTKVQYLIDLFVPSSNEGFTFPDGETWNVSGADGLSS